MCTGMKLRAERADNRVHGIITQQFRKISFMSIEAVVTLSNKLSY